MSSVSSAELEVFPSVSDGQECEPSPSARSSPIAGPSCDSTGQMSLFSMTFKPSTFTKDGLWPTPTRDTSLQKNNYKQGGLPLGRALLMSSAEASPARTSLSPERA